MRKSSIISRVKTLLNEVLSPGTDSLTVTLTETPLDTFLDDISDIAVRSLFRDIPKRTIDPYSIKWAKVLSNNAGVIKFEDAYDISSLTIDSFEGIGMISIIKVTALEEDIPEAAIAFLGDQGTIFTCTSDGEIYLTASLSIDAQTNDVFLYAGTQYYKIDGTFEIDDYLLVFTPLDSDSEGYFKNVLLSDTTFLSMMDSEIKAEETEHALESFKNFTFNEWVKDSNVEYVSYYAPKTFVSLVSMRHASWTTNYPKVIFIDNPEYKLQENQYTKSGYMKPVVGVKKLDNGLYCLEIFSRKDASDTLSDGLMIQVVPIQFIQDELVDHICWLIAYHYLLITGKQESQAALAMYQKKIQEL